MGKKSKKSKTQVNKIEAAKDEPEEIEPVKEPIERNESSRALTGEDEEEKSTSKISNIPVSYIAEKNPSPRHSPRASPRVSITGSMFSSFGPDSKEEKKTISPESSSVEPSKFQMNTPKQ